MNKNSTNNNNQLEEIYAAPTVKSFFSYLGCIGIALIVMYYINGTVGILSAFALAIAFSFSIITTIIVKHFIVAEASLDKTLVTKGENFQCVIRLSKKILLPAPMIDIHISCSPQLTKETDVCRAAVAGNETNVIIIPITAKYSGLAEVTIDNIWISDYLGIFHMKLKSHILNKPMQTAVYPDIPDIPIQTDFLKAAVLYTQSEDEEEENNESSTEQSGLPGYEHREYIPGDPLKRINWKMSSKRDIYMVRLNEKISQSGQVFILDTPPVSENNITLSVRDIVIEGMLAIFTMLIREGRETTVFYAEKDNWQKSEINNIADIEALQEHLAKLTPCKMNDSVPPELLSMGKTPICFTASVSKEMQSILQIISQCPDILIVCGANSGLPLLTSEIWVLSNEFELKKQS